MSQMIFEKSCKILNSCLSLSSHELYSRWGSKNCRWRMRQMFWQNGSDVKMMNSFQISIWRLPSLDMGNTFIWEGTISRAGVQAPKSFFHPFFFHSKQIWSDRIERADTGCLARSARARAHFVTCCSYCSGGGNWWARNIVQLSSPSDRRPRSFRIGNLFSPQKKSSVSWIGESADRAPAIEFFRMGPFCINDRASGVDSVALFCHIDSLPS